MAEGSALSSRPLLFATPSSRSSPSRTLQPKVLGLALRGAPREHGCCQLYQVYQEFHGLYLQKNQMRRRCPALDVPAAENKGSTSVRFAPQWLCGRLSSMPLGFRLATDVVPSPRGGGCGSNAARPHASHVARTDDRSQPEGIATSLPITPGRMRERTKVDRVRSRSSLIVGSTFFGTYGHWRNMAKPIRCESFILGASVIGTHRFG